MPENVDLENKELEETKKDLIEESKDKKKDKTKTKKKEKKQKKEKAPKEKKSGSGKKMLILLIVMLITIGALLAAYKFVPKMLSNRGDYYDVNFIINYHENKFFNKYDLTASFNGSLIGSASQGETIEYSTSLPNGEYVITFLQSDEPANTTSSVIKVKGDTNVLYKVKADWKGLKYSENINPKKFEISNAVTEKVEETEETTEEVMVEE